MTQHNFGIDSELLEIKFLEKFSVSLFSISCLVQVSVLVSRVNH